MRVVLIYDGLIDNQEWARWLDVPSLPPVGAWLNLHSDGSYKDLNPWCIESIGFIEGDEFFTLWVDYSSMGPDKDLVGYLKEMGFVEKSELLKEER